MNGRVHGFETCGRNSVSAQSSQDPPLLLCLLDVKHIPFPTAFVKALISNILHMKVPNQTIASHENNDMNSPGARGPWRKKEKLCLWGQTWPHWNCPDVRIKNEGNEKHYPPLTHSPLWCKYCPFYNIGKEVLHCMEMYCITTVLYCLENSGTSQHQHFLSFSYLVNQIIFMRH